MNKQQGLAIVDGLRRAQATGGPVVELAGKDARNFAFVKDEASRKELLGSFRIDADKTFFVSVVSSPKNDDDYGFDVFERVGGKLLLGSPLADSVGVIWSINLPSSTGATRRARKHSSRPRSPIRSRSHFPPRTSARSAPP